MNDYNDVMIIRSDKIEKVGTGTIIQHGKLNDRIYLMKLHKRDVAEICNILSDIALNNKYGKIFCKIPKKVAPLFFADGYHLEAQIPGFYNRTEDVFFVSKFLNSYRTRNIETDKLESLHILLKEEKIRASQKPLPKSYNIRRLYKSDTAGITAIYREVFESYPFPIHDEAYIAQTMDENVQYFGVEADGKLAALSSSEIDFKGKNAEMTDFATSAKFTGKGLSLHLLAEMEKHMAKQDITTLYTIARLNSVPMNKTFIRGGYVYSGTLIKNTNISGNIESMNVYYKHIS